MNHSLESEAKILTVNKIWSTYYTEIHNSVIWEEASHFNVMTWCTDHIRDMKYGIMYCVWVVKVICPLNKVWMKRLQIGIHHKRFCRGVTVQLVQTLFHTNCDHLNIINNRAHFRSLKQFLSSLLENLPS